jgi:hypothetical protein
MAAEAEAALIPASERYSIRLEKADDDVLRQVLAAAEKHTGPIAQRLLRDQKKLHHLYGHMLRLGFGVEAVEACLPNLRADAALTDALDWCCLHLAETALPPSFRLSRVGDAPDDDAGGAGAPAGAKPPAPVSRPVIRDPNAGARRGGTNPEPEPTAQPKPEPKLDPERKHVSQPDPEAEAELEPEPEPEPAPHRPPERRAE